MQAPVDDLIGFVARSVKPLFTVAVTLALAVAYISTYRERRHWEDRLHRWQDRLNARIDVLRVLIAEGQEIQRAHPTERDPVPAYEAFIDRCERSLREHFGAPYAARINTWASADWEQPRGLRADEQIFARFDTERRLAGLKTLLAEVEHDLSSLTE
jgi:hypothetical protein